jgi:hypothetical protein
MLVDHVVPKVSQVSIVKGCAVIWSISSTTASRDSDLSSGTVL